MASGVSPQANPTSTSFNRHLTKLPLVGLVVLALIMGVWSALVRLGWALPTPIAGMSALHGPLMIGGVLGTVIGLERAVATAALMVGPINAQTRRSWHWAYLAPLGSGLSGLFLIIGTTTAGQLAAIAGSVILAAVYVRLLKIHITAYTMVMGAGALLWLGGNLLWLGGRPFYLIVHWWIGFLVLTVVGERLELARMTSMPVWRRNLFLAAIGVYLVGILLTLVQFDAAIRIAGLGQLLAAMWMARYDIARRTVRKPGLARYIAICLLSGYAWLSAAGGMGLYFGAVYGGYAYDALIHAVLLGFIFAMIFGHAPIILPALTGLHVRFSNLFYVPLAALHLTLLLRTVGNLTQQTDLRLWGGMFNVVTLALFFSVLAYSILSGRGERSALG